MHENSDEICMKRKRENLSNLSLKIKDLRSNSGKKIPSDTNKENSAQIESEIISADEPAVKKMKNDESEQKPPTTAEPERNLEMFVPLKYFEAWLNCPMCMERYDENARLPKIIAFENCEQTACSQCILKLHENSLITCPLCHGKHVRPDNGMSAYPSNKLVLDLLKIPIIRIDAADLKATQLLGFKENTQSINKNFEGLSARMQNYRDELKTYLKKQCEIYMQELTAKTNLFIQDLDSKNSETFKNFEMIKENIELKLNDYTKKSDSKSPSEKNDKLASDYLVKKMDHMKKSLDSYENTSLILVNLDCKEKILHKILRPINKSTTEPNETTTSTTTINKIAVTKLKFKNESQISYDSIHAMSPDKIFFLSDDVANGSQKNIKSFNVVDGDMEELAVQTCENTNLSFLNIRGVDKANLFVELIDKISNLMFLAHYDGKFHKFKSFDTKSRRLHFVNKDEIILHSNKKVTQLFTVLNQTLSKNCTFGQTNDETQPFFFKSRDVQIIGMNSSKIIFRYKAEKETLLVMSRTNGSILNKINLTKDLETTTKMEADIENVQINDDLCSIVVFREEMLLRIFDINGELICNKKLTMSNDYDRFKVAENMGLAFYYLSQNEIQHLKYDSLIDTKENDREE